MKKKVLVVILIILIILIVGISVIFFLNKSYVPYDDYDMNNISNYLSINSFYTDDFFSGDISVTDDIKNKIVSSYLISHGENIYDYGYDTASECYKYFSSSANIFFYKSDYVDGILKVLGISLDKKDQDDVMGYNIFDYYYGRVIYEEDDDNTDIDNGNNNTNNDIININGKYFNYSDLFNSDNVCINASSYSDYLDVVRFYFSYDKKKDNYYLDKILFIK